MIPTMLERQWARTETGNLCYYRMAAAADRPTVVFLHGLSANHTTWEFIMRFLAERGYGSVAPDLRGHGESDKTIERARYRLPVFADDLEIIAEHAKLTQCILVGYSFGGSIALDYASRYPARVLGIVVISANHRAPLEYQHLGFLTPLACGFLRALAFLFMWQKREHYLAYDHTKALGYWHSVWVGLNTMPLSVNFWMLAEVLGMDLRKAVGKIRVPALILRAASDPFVTAREAGDIQRAIPGSSVVTPTHISHFIASQAQEESAELIFTFLRKVCG